MCTGSSESSPLYLQIAKYFLHEALYTLPKLDQKDFTRGVIRLGMCEAIILIKYFLKTYLVILS